MASDPLPYGTLYNHKEGKMALAKGNAVAKQCESRMATLGYQAAPKM